MTATAPVRWWRARLVAVVVITAAFVLAIIALGALTPGYRPAAETVSRLGSDGQPHAAVVRVLFVAYGVAVLGACGPLGRVVTAAGGVFSGSVAVYACAGVVAGLAPKDPDGVPVTAASQVHVAATIIGGAALVLAMLLVARWGRGRPDRLVAGAASVSVAVGSIVFRQTWGWDWYGMVERALLGVALAWVALLCLRLLADPQRAGLGGPAPPGPVDGRR